MMTPRDPSTDELLAGLLTIGLEAAEAATELIRDERPTRLDVGTKSTATDHVTNMDLESEALIRSVILSTRPGDRIIGEESNGEARATGSTSDGMDVTWIIDPIDGTTNYLYDLQGYNISIAASLHGRMVVGIVADPAHHRVYHAVRGAGAYCNGTLLDVTETGRGRPDLETALVATGFAYSPEVRGQQGRIVSELLPRIRDIRRLGAAALDLCHVAAGRVDAYFEVGLEEWDVAAGALIAAEAGALVGPIRGGPDMPTSVVAAHPAIYDELQELLSRLGAGSPAP